MFAADEGVAVVMGTWLFGWQGRFETCPYGLAGWRGLGVVVAWPRSAPGPHPNPLPSNGRGGMFVADECVAAVMGVWLFGCLVGRAGLEPAPTPGGLHRWTGMGVLVAKGRGCLVGESATEVGFG